MKRRSPSQERSKETVNRIMQALSRIIESDGYATATTAKIAKEAGLGVATVYAYFEDKEDILFSLVDQEGSEALQLLSNGLPEWISGDKESSIRALLHFVVHEVMKRAALTKTVMIHTPHLIETPKAARLVGQFEMILGLVFVNQDDIPDRNTDSFITINAMLGLILGIANGLPSDVTPEELVNRLERMAILQLKPHN